MKRNWKLEAKFFGLFQRLYPGRKQTYKVKLSAKWGIHNMFHMSLLEQDNIRKGRINEFTEVPKFESSDNKEYEVEAIRDSAVYTKKANGHLLGLYYLVAWKDYLEKKNTWESSSTVMYLWKMVNTFYKDHLEKQIAISPPLNSAPPMTKPTIQLPVKQKRGRPIGRAKKCTKWDNKEKSESVRFSRAKSRQVAGDLSP